MRILYKGKNSPECQICLTTGTVIPSPVLPGVFISNRRGKYNKTFVPTIAEQ